MNYLVFVSIGNEQQHRQVTFSILSFYASLKADWQQYKVVVYTNDPVFFQGFFKSWIYTEKLSGNAESLVIKQEFFINFAGKGIIASPGIVFESSGVVLFEKLNEGFSPEHKFIEAFHESETLKEVQLENIPFFLPKEDKLNTTLSDFFNSAYYLDFSDILKHTPKVISDLKEN